MPHSLWFIACYILLYAFHPCLNAMIRALNKEKHLLLVVVLFILYSCYTFILESNEHYCRIIGMLVIYLDIAYVKIYMQNFTKSLKANILLLSVGILGQVFLLLLSDFMGIKIDSFSDEMLRWDTLMNPCFIIIAIAAINIANRGRFVNGTINYLSSLSLLVYMFHANLFVRVVILPDIITKLMSFIGANIISAIFLSWVLLTVASVVVAILYKLTIQKVIHKITDFITSLIGKLYKSFEKLFLKIN